MQPSPIPEGVSDAAVAPLPTRQRADLRPYANEKRLFTIMAVISGLFWVALTVTTLGIIWIVMLLLYLLGLVAFSYFISYVRGNGVRVTAEQFPDLHQRFEACCRIIGMDKRPEFYLLTGHGVLNAFATRFLHRYYVVLYSDIVDALDGDPEALNFYIGHELGHIAQKHLVHHWWLVFARWIPLLGPAYSRAREYTCDQYGLLCTNNRLSAVRALSVLAAGSRRWKTMNPQAYIAQTAQTSGFWMALNELTADYPWLCKRVARIERDDSAALPRRSFWAWLLALLVPNTGFGLLGAILVYAYLLIFLITPGIAAYSGYTERAKQAALHEKYKATQVQLDKVYAVAKAAGAAVSSFYDKDQELPASLEKAGFQNPDTQLVKEITLDSDSAEIALQLSPPLNHKIMTLAAALDNDRHIVWTCSVGGYVASKDELPEGCTAVESSEENVKEEMAAVPERSLFSKILGKLL